MTKRLKKKLNKKYRCQFIADKIGTELRTNWVWYFREHPEDIALTKKFLKQAERESCVKCHTYVSTLSHDIRTNYICPGFDELGALCLIRYLEHGDFFWYMAERKKKFMGISRTAMLKVHELPQVYSEDELGPEGIPY
jgi:hypothetical protein